MLRAIAVLVYYFQPSHYYFDYYILFIYVFVYFYEIFVVVIYVLDKHCCSYMLMIN